MFLQISCEFLPKIFSNQISGGPATLAQRAWSEPTQNEGPKACLGGHLELRAKLRHRRHPIIRTTSVRQVKILHWLFHSVFIVYVFLPNHLPLPR